jgi:hypothetical protein
MLENIGSQEEKTMDEALIYAVKMYLYSEMAGTILLLIFAVWVWYKIRQFDKFRRKHEKSNNN